MERGTANKGLLPHRGLSQCPPLWGRCFALAGGSRTHLQYLGLGWWHRAGVKLPADTGTATRLSAEAGAHSWLPPCFQLALAIPRAEISWKQGPGFWVASLSASSMCPKNVSGCQEHEQGKNPPEAISKALSLSYHMLQLRFPQRPSLLPSSSGTSPQNPAMLKPRVEKLSPGKGSL